MPIENLLPWLITKLRKIVALGRAGQVKLALKCFAFPADLFLQRAAGGTHDCGNPHSGTGLDTHSMPAHISPFALVMNAMSFISCHSPSQWSHISLLFLEQATGLLLTLEPLNCYGMFSLPLSLPSFFKNLIPQGTILLPHRFSCISSFLFLYVLLNNLHKILRKWFHIIFSLVCLLQRHEILKKAGIMSAMLCIDCACTY